MVRWCVLVVVAACERDDTPPPITKTEILWESGTDRLVLDAEIFPAFPHATARYLVTLEHANGSEIVLAGHLQPEQVDLRATRLRDGHLAWATADLVCEELGPLQVACNDFADLNCFPEGCCSDTPAPVTCACGAGAPDGRLSGALRWVAGDTQRHTWLRAGAVFALARTGSRSEALKLADALNHDEEPRIWIDAIRLGTQASKQLHEKYSTASSCERDQVDRATAAR